MRGPSQYFATKEESMGSSLRKNSFTVSHPQMQDAAKAITTAHNAVSVYLNPIFESLLYQNSHSGVNGH